MLRCASARAWSQTPASALPTPRPRTSHLPGEFCYSQPADDPDTGIRTTWSCQDCRRQSVWVAMVPVLAPVPDQRSQDFQVMDQRTIAYVEVIQSREFLQEVHRQLWITFFAAILASLCLLGAATYAIARFFTAPLTHITESIRGIQSDTEIIRPVQVRHTRGITEISALRDAFRGLQRRLGHSWEVRQQLASNLSHELRNALGALELDIATLSRHVRKDRFAAEVAADMKQNVSELLEMSDRSLNALFTETGHVALNLETVELEPLVQQVLASVEEVAADRNVRVSLDSLDGVESVEVDRVYFKNDVLLETGAERHQLHRRRGCGHDWGRRLGDMVRHPHQGHRARGWRRSTGKRFSTPTSGWTRPTIQASTTAGWA